VSARHLRAGLATAFATGQSLSVLIAGSWFSSCFVAQAQDNVRWGVVRSNDGKTMDRVWVQKLGAWWRATEADGRFDFPSGEAPITLLFFKDGFRPQLRVVGTSEGLDGLTVVLEPETAAAVKLRSCRQHGRLLPVLEPLRVQGLRLRQLRDAEYAGYSGTYEYHGSPAEFWSSTGVHSGAMTPTRDWVAGLKSLAVGSLTCGGNQWFDLRGATDSGLESRWLGGLDSEVVYSKVPAPVADVFDKAIDKGCCH